MPYYAAIARIKLIENHQQTGMARHFIRGSQMSAPDALKIVQFEGDKGYYLLYLDQHGVELTDTYYDSLNDALEQANMEFGVKQNEWNLPTSG